MSRDIVNPKEFETVIGALASGYREYIAKRIDMPGVLVGGFTVKREINATFDELERMIGVVWKGKAKVQGTTLDPIWDENI